MDIKPGKKLECPQCSKTFKFKSEPAHHVVTHDPAAKVKCDVSLSIRNLIFNFDYVHMCANLQIFFQVFVTQTLFLFRSAVKFTKIQKPYRPTCEQPTLNRNSTRATFVSVFFTRLPAFEDTITSCTTLPGSDPVCHVGLLDVRKPT